jgi:hypothetical protein
VSEAWAVIAAAFVAAGAAGWIGWLQYTQLRLQSRIALFDKRWESYLSTDLAVAAVCQTSRPTVDHLLQLNRELRRVRLLFPRGVADTINVARRCTQTMGALHHEIWSSAGETLGASQSTINEFHAAQRQMIGIWENLFEIFLPHMQLADAQPWITKQLRSLLE